METLKTEVEKGSMGTVMGHGLADPKTLVRHPYRKELDWRCQAVVERGLG